MATPDPQPKRVEITMTASAQIVVRELTAERRSRVALAHAGTSGDGPDG